MERGTVVKIKGIIEKSGKSFLLGHTIVWFVIGCFVTYFLKMIPLLNRIEFLQDKISLAAFLALAIGFVGGVFVLIRTEAK